MPYTFKSFILDLETVMGLLFFIFAFFSHNKAFLLIFFKSICALFRKKLISFKRENIKKCLYDEFFHNILFVGTLLLIKNYLRPTDVPYLFFVFVPNMIHFTISLSEYFRFKRGFVYEMLDEQIDYMISYKCEFLPTKSNMEFVLVIVFVIEYFLGRISFWGILLYLNFLRIKYITNSNMRFACNRLDYRCMRILGTKWYCKPLLIKYKFVRSVLGKITGI